MRKTAVDNPKEKQFLLWQRVKLICSQYFLIGCCLSAPRLLYFSSLLIFRKFFSTNFRGTMI